MAKSKTKAPARPPRKPVQRSISTFSWVIVGVIVAIAAAIVVVGMHGRPQKQAAEAKPAPPAVVRAVTTVPDAAFNAAGASAPPPQAVTGPPLRQEGKPEALNIGAEYCPYCAAERWALVAALSRFGHFSHLGATESATNDIFPRTQTFSFHGSQFSSDWVAFSAVETATNKPTASGG